MKKILVSTFALLTIWIPFVLEAQTDQTACCSNFDLFVDYLYWHVCNPNALVLDSSNIGTQIDPDYEPGWRVGAFYQGCLWDAGVRYTYFRSTSTKDLTDPPFPASQVGQAKYSFDWDVVDVELGACIGFKCAPIEVRPFVGAKLTWVEESFVYPSVNNIKVKVDAYGLYLGGELRYAFFHSPCRLIESALLFRTSWGVLRGVVKRPVLESGVIQFLIEDERAYLAIGEVSAGLDLVYNGLSCVTPHLFIGYEAQNFIDWKQTSGFSDVKSLGIEGLVVRVRAEF